MVLITHKQDKTKQLLKFLVSGCFSVFPIFFSSHLCHPVMLTRLVYVHAIVYCPLLSGLLPFPGLAVSTVLDGCCLGLCHNLKRKLTDQFVIHIVSHYFDLYYTIMHVLLEAYNIYIHMFTLRRKLNYKHMHALKRPPPVNKN